MRIQAVSVQCFRDAESVEHAADTVDAQAPEWALAVSVHQLKESLYLLPSGWVELHVAAFPARPGVGCHLEKLRCLGLRQVPQSASQVDQL